MVVRLSLTVQDMSVLRFAVSPLWEIVASIRTLRDPAAHVIHLPWITRVRDRLPADDAGFELLWALIPPTAHLLPGFLAPTPDSPLPDVHREIEGLRELPAESVREAITGTFGTDPPTPVHELHRDPLAQMPALVAQLHRYWHLAFSEEWPRMLGVLEGDLRYRSVRLTGGGPKRLFADLAPTVAWDDGTLTVHDTVTSVDHSLQGRGLTLVPSIFAWPRVFTKAAEPWAPVLRYPARGIVSLWDEPVVADPDLAAVLGRSRARLLVALAHPASTTELARRTGLAPSGVSAHLGKLRAAGLVSASRAGRSVLYARTARGTTLAGDRSNSG